MPVSCSGRSTRLLLTGEVDLTRWSAVKGMTIRIGSPATSRIVDQSGWKDVLSYRAGVESSHWPTSCFVPARGTRRVRSRMQISVRRSPMQIASTIAFGIGYAVEEGLILDLGVQVDRYADRTVTNSARPLRLSSEYFNGTYKLSSTVIALTHQLFLEMNMTTPINFPGEPESTLDGALQHGLTEEEYGKILKILGRVPTYTELGIYSVMWSEHCSYKNSIAQIKTLPRSGGRLLVGAGEENAGLVDIGDGLAVAFKIESHNHPSAVEPYQGAATGVGGIMRDIFTMGARPIASLNSLRFGSLENARTRHLFDGVVRGIGDYGNSFGVPTVAGEVYFDPCYQDNPLVNAMSVGVVKHGAWASATAKGAGQSCHDRRLCHGTRRHSWGDVRIGRDLRGVREETSVGAGR